MVVVYASGRCLMSLSIKWEITIPVVKKFDKSFGRQRNRKRDWHRGVFMGNTTTRSSELAQRGIDGVYKQSGEDLCQNGSLSSGRTLASFNSHNSSTSLFRSWSRISRKRWKESTLSYESSKTVWPISQTESFFLPEFPVLPNNERNFENLGELNKGAFGKVYKVKNQEEIYALKILSKSKIIKENSIRQVKDEVQIQRVCGHHPFIVNCPFHWQSKKRLYIVSDYISGGELYTLLKSYSVLSVALVRIYVAQLALAIDFLHNAGIVYRDLKPENILLDEYGNIQLIDFGLSKWLPYGRTTATICGTLLYMAPEIWRRCEYGHAADWWSLGVIACLMLTGKYPSAEMDFGRVELPKITDLACQDLLLRLLQIEPAKRLRSLRMLQTIAFYKGFNFDDIREKKIIPRELLQDIPKIEDIIFEDFDESFDTAL